MFECLSFVFTQFSCQESVGSLEHFVPQLPQRDTLWDPIVKEIGMSFTTFLFIVTTQCTFTFMHIIIHNTNLGWKLK